MRAIVAIATLALATGAANAAPIYLACDGKTTAIRQGEKDRVFKEVRSLTVDFSAKAVTLDVNFQEVVHSVLTRNSDVAKRQ